MWKEIKGFEGIYQLNENGDVRNSKGKILSPYKNTTGAVRVGLYKNGVKRDVVVARLVGEHFVNNPDPQHYDRVIHLDLNQSNNYYKNLKWTNQKGVIDHLIQCDRMTLSKYKGYVMCKKRNSRPVLQFDLDGNFIREFENSYDVERILGIGHSGVNQCCRGKSKTCGGYQWRFKI